MQPQQTTTYLLEKPNGKEEGQTPSGQTKRHGFDGIGRARESIGGQAQFEARESTVRHGGKSLFRVLFKRESGR